MRITEEELAEIKRRQDANLAAFQRNSGRGLPIETVKAIEQATGVQHDDNGAPVPAALVPVKRARKAKPAALPVPLEEEEGKALFQWAQAQRWHGRPIAKILIHIPNGSFRGYDRRGAAITAGKLKAQGMQPGVSDYLVPVPIWTKQCAGLWIELKRLKGGSVSTEQTDFHTDMLALGYRCEVARGWEAASKIILEHLRSVPG